MFIIWRGNLRVCDMRKISLQWLHFLVEYLLMWPVWWAFLNFSFGNNWSMNFQLPPQQELGRFQQVIRLLLQPYFVGDVEQRHVPCLEECLVSIFRGSNATSSISSRVCVTLWRSAIVFSYSIYVFSFYLLTGIINFLCPLFKLTSYNSHFFMAVLSFEWFIAFLAFPKFVYGCIAISPTTARTAVFSAINCSMLTPWALK